MTNTKRVAVMSLVAAFLLAMVVGMVSADVGSQTWYLCTDTSLNKTVPASGSIDVEIEGMGLGTKSFLAEPTQCNLTMGAGTWTAYIDFNAADAGTIDLQVLKKLNGMSKTFANTTAIPLSAGHYNITQDIVSSASEDFEAGKKLEFKIFWHPDDGASKLTVYCGEGKSNFSSPSSDPGYPIPELNTILLFSSGLLALVGYVALQRRKN